MRSGCGRCVMDVSDCFAGSVVAIEAADKGAEFSDGPRLATVLLGSPRLPRGCGPRHLCVIRAVTREEWIVMTRIQDEDFAKAQEGGLRVAPAHLAGGE